MKVLFDHQIFILQKYGGISKYFYELMKIFSADNNLDIYFFQGYNINSYRLSDICCQRSKNLKYYFSRKAPEIMKARLLYLEINKIIFKLKFSKTGADFIYHPSYYNNILKKFKGKVIVTVHDMTHELFPEYFSRLDKTPKWKKEIFRRADGLICISESTKNDLLKFYDIEEEKIKIIYHGNPKLPEVSATAIVNEPYILFVGARNGYKNFDMLYEIYTQSRELHDSYKLVTFGGRNFNKTELQKINERSFQNKVLNIQGDDSVLANLYKNASVFVFPSKYEGFGFPMLEAMQLGCPILACKTSSLPEIGGEASEYFEPDNQEDMKTKLINLLQNKERRDYLTSRGYQHVKNFSWEKCARETIKFYEYVRQR